RAAASELCCSAKNITSGFRRSPYLCGPSRFPYDSNLVEHDLALDPGARDKFDKSGERAILGSIRYAIVDQDDAACRQVSVELRQDIDYRQIEIDIKKDEGD